MNEVLRIGGVAGAGIAGVMLTIAAGSATGWQVMLALLGGCILGGLFPLVGCWAGIAGVVGLFLTTVVDFDASQGWPLSIGAGITVGVILSAGRGFARRGRGGRPRGFARPATRRAHPGLRFTGPITVLTLGPLTGAAIGILVFGVHMVGSWPFFLCVGFGAGASVALLLGLACGRVARPERQ